MMFVINCVQRVSINLCNHSSNFILCSFVNSYKYLHNPAIAFDRWEILFFIYGLIYAYVSENPVGWNIGSHPNWLLPLGFTIIPYVFPMNILGVARLLLINPTAHRA